MTPTTYHRWRDMSDADLIDSITSVHGMRDERAAEVVSRWQDDKRKLQDQVRQLADEMEQLRALLTTHERTRLAA